MKVKYFIYGLFGLSLLFAGVTGYLYFFQTQAMDEGGLGSVPATRLPQVEDRSRTVSGKGGKLLIAYAGDIKGSLEPCG